MSPAAQQQTQRACRRVTTCCVALLHLLHLSSVRCLEPSGNTQVDVVSNTLPHHARDKAFIGWSEQHHGALGATGSNSSTTVKPNSSSQTLVISSRLGQIKIRLRPEFAPKIVQLVVQLAQSGHCPRCNFYRHEPAPSNFGTNGFYGPPYALLQGSLADLAEDPPLEGNPVVRKGDVCMIPRCKEFFIATADHVEWGASHTVWGQVADEDSWKAINSAPYEPYTNRTDSGRITTRWLKAEVHVPFNVSLISG